MTQRNPQQTPELQRELETHLETLRELGPQYTDTVAASLMERIERMVDARIEARLARQPRERSSDEQVKMLAVSLSLAIPLIAIAASSAQFAGIFIVCVALVLINLMSYLPRPR